VDERLDDLFRNKGEQLFRLSAPAVDALAALLELYRTDKRVGRWMRRQLKAYYRHLLNSGQTLRHQAAVRYPRYFVTEGPDEAIPKADAVSRLWKMFPCKISNPLLLSPNLWETHRFAITDKEPSIDVWTRLLTGSSKHFFTEAGFEAMPVDVCVHDTQTFPRVELWLAMGLDFKRLPADVLRVFTSSYHLDLGDIEHAKALAYALTLFSADRPVLSCQSPEAFKNAALLLSAEQIASCVRQCAPGLSANLYDPQGSVESSKWYCFALPPQYIRAQFKGEATAATYNGTINGTIQLLF